MGDISRDKGAALRVSEYQFIQSIDPDSLQEGRPVSVVEALADRHGLLFQRVPVGPRTKFYKGTNAAKLVVGVGKCLDGPVDGKDDIGIIEECGLPVPHDGGDGKGVFSQFPLVSDFQSGLVRKLLADNHIAGIGQDVWPAFYKFQIGEQLKEMPVCRNYLGLQHPLLREQEIIH